MNGDKKHSFLIGDGTGTGLPESDYFAFEHVNIDVTF